MTEKKSAASEYLLPDQEEQSAKMIRQQHTCIMNSQEFEATKAQKAFLRFVVEKTLNGRSEEIKGYTVATEVFGRGSDFDQATDPVVSIHANKLRRALERYYLTAGKKDPIRIDMPKGTYVPTFIRQVPEQPDVVPGNSIFAIDFEASLPSVLILPFKNLTGDANKDHIGIGFASELAVEITRYQEIKVLYPIEEQLQSDLTGKCRFVLAGNIYDTGPGIKITLHVTDMKTNQQIWGDTHSFPIETKEILAFKEQLVYIIANKIAGQYGVIPKTMARDSRHKPPVELSTYEAILRYYEHDYAFTAENFNRALESLTRASETEPDCGQVWTMLAHLYSYIYSLDFPGSEKALERAIKYAEKGAHICQDNQRSLAILALVRFFSNELTAALTETERAIELNPNSLLFMDGFGYIMTLSGEWEQGTRMIKKAMQLNPLYRPGIHYPLWLDGLRRRDFEGAYMETMSLKRSEIFWYPLAKASTLGLLGRTEEAKGFYEKLLELKPDFPAKSRTLIRRYIKFDNLVECVMDGLKKAGLDEASA